MDKYISPASRTDSLQRLPGLEYDPILHLYRHTDEYTAQSQTLRPITRLNRYVLSGQY